MSVREQNARTQEAIRRRIAERAAGLCEYCGHTPGCYCQCPIRRGHKRVTENREVAQP